MNLSETVTLKLENFEGPIGLLYHLIEKNKIDIYDIPIAEITRQYMEVLNDAKRRNMEIMSEFLIMAASLLEIKSRLLLPKPKNEAEEEEEDPREELIRKLVEYKKFKEAAEELKEREEKAAYTVFKKPDSSLAMFKEEEKQEIDEILKGITFNDLVNAYEEVMRRKELKTDRVRSSFRSVKPDEFTIGEKIDYINDMLAVTPRVSFWQIFRNDTSKAEIVVTFMALLELIKSHAAGISQNEIFGEIIITKINGSDNYEAV